MIIHRMTARFGCLDGESLELGRGMNLLYAPNEGGKSTWCAFVRAMLYGIDTRSREKKSEMAEKQRYRPWNGGPMEGMLECSHEGQRIILRRTSESGVPMGDFSAVYQNTGMAVPGMTGENVGELLTGVGREVFERSVFVRQTHLPVDESQQLEQRIAAILFTGGEELSWSQAQETLKQWQRSRRYNKSGQLVKLEAEQQITEAELEQLSQLHQEQLLLQEEAAEHRARLQVFHDQQAAEHRELEESTKKRWAEAAAELDAAQLQLETMEQEDVQLEDEALEELEDEIALREKDIKGRGRAVLFFSFLGLAMGLALMASTLVHMEFDPVTLAAAIALAGGVVLIGNLIRVRLDQRDYREIDLLIEELEERQATLEMRDLEWEAAISRERAAQQYLELVAYQQEVPAQQREALEAERDLARVEQKLALITGRLQELGDPVQLEAELTTMRKEHKALSQQYEAIEIALTALGDAERQLRARFSPALNEQTGRYFAHMTGGAYEKVNLERDFSAMAEPKGSLALRSIRQLSQGTVDQLYLSLRLAIGDLLLPADAPCPLILDDALMSFDDARCQQALRLLKFIAERRQVILFSSQRREAAALSGDPTILRQRITRETPA